MKISSRVRGSGALMTRGRSISTGVPSAVMPVMTRSTSSTLVVFGSMSSATTRPRRITTMRSTTWKTWWMLWAMKMQEWPESRALRTKLSTPCVSATPRLLVGSSRMMRSLSKCMARAIATAWRSPPESEPIGVVGGMFLVMPTLRRSSPATAFIAAWSMRFEEARAA